MEDDGKADSPAGAWYTLPPGVLVVLYSQDELRDDAENAWLIASQGGWVAVRQWDYHRVVLMTATIEYPPRKLIEWDDYLLDAENIYENVAIGHSVNVRRGGVILLLRSSALLAPFDATLDQIEQWLRLGVAWEVGATSKRIFDETDATPDEIEQSLFLGVSWQVDPPSERIFEEIRIDDVPPLEPPEVEPERGIDDDVPSLEPPEVEPERGIDDDVPPLEPPEVEPESGTDEP
jgi:hypothetical protein